MMWSSSSFFAGVVLGTMICLFVTRILDTDPTDDASGALAQKICDADPPQVFNFIKEMKCRGGHMSVPPLLKENGYGKVVVDIGLDAGDEFFAALASGYSVFGFEANPLSIEKLRVKCEAATAYRCVYVDAKNITSPLTPIVNGGYLIHGGAGSERTVMKMSLYGAGSSLVETAPGVKAPTYEEVTIVPVSDVVDTDVFFFKLDVQGFEFQVLKGAKELFEKHTVKTMLMEVYPRGLGNAGVDFLEILKYLWNDLGLLCSSSLPPSPGSFEIDHPGSFPEHAQYLESISQSEAAKTTWGKFDDFYCFNRRKTWSQENVLNALQTA